MKRFISFRIFSKRSSFSISIDSFRLESFTDSVKIIRSNLLFLNFVLINSKSLKQAAPKSTLVKLQSLKLLLLNSARLKSEFSIRQFSKVESEISVFLKVKLLNSQFLKVQVQK